MPAARAASSREAPSSTRASIRREAAVSRHRLASRRSSTAPGSFRLIPTVMAPPPIGYTADQPRQAPRGSGRDDASAIRPVGMSGRQVFRLLARFRAEGAPGLASRRRGRPSNRRLPEAVREAALAVVRERYADFGPTLAAEKLAEAHDLRLSRETLRQWMSEAGLWVPRKARRGRVHQPRHRRDRLGELVQIDGCQHPWFEDRGPPCTLLVFVDDATSRLMHLRFVPAESAFAYMAATRAYIEAHGKPVAFYSDKHGIFRVNHPDAAGGDGM